MVSHLTVDQQLILQRTCFPNVDEKIVRNSCSFVESLRVAEGTLPGVTTQLKSLDFPANGLTHFCHALQVFPHASKEEVLERIYPPKLIFREESQTKLWNEGLTRFQLKDKHEKEKGYILKEVQQASDTTKKLVFQVNGTNEMVSMNVPAGPLPSQVDGQDFVETPSLKRLINGMLMDHALGRDICIVMEFQRFFLLLTICSILSKAGRRKRDWQKCSGSSVCKVFGVRSGNDDAVQGFECARVVSNTKY